MYSRGTLDAALDLCQTAVTCDMRIDAKLFKELAYVFREHFEEDTREDFAWEGLQLAYAPTAGMKAYGTYIDATAKAVFGSSSEDINPEDGTIVDLRYVIMSTSDIFGRSPDAASFAYLSMTACLIMTKYFGYDDEAMSDDRRNNAKSFLARMGVVHSYACIGGEDEPDGMSTDGMSLVDVLLSHEASYVENDKGRYWASRHMAACFFRARCAARTIQRAWRARKLRMQNAARCLHMINKYADHLVALPAGVVHIIALFTR